MYNRQEGVERNALHQKPRAEDKLLQARKKMQEAKPKIIIKDRTREDLYLLPAEEVGFKRQERQQKVNKANIQRFHQNVSVGKFNSAVLKEQMDKDNDAMMELKKRKQEMAEYENRKYDQMMRSKQEEALKREQEEVLQRKLRTHSVAEYQVRQMKERELLKQKERLQDQKDGEILRGLDELHAQELRRQAEKKAESKKSNLKYRLEDISRRNLDTERQRQILRTEEKKAKLAQLEREEKLLQRKTEQSERFRKLQTPKQIVRDKLEASKKEQAATMALREDRRFIKDVATREAELVKQQKGKEEKRAAMLQSVSAHRQNVIREKEQKEKAERQSSVNQLQAEKEADRLFLAQEKLKAQKIREDKIKFHNFNVSLAAEKRSRLHKPKGC